MYCKHCGKEISDDSRFCGFCGKPQIGKTAETISAGEDAFKDIGIEGMGAMGRQVTQIQLQGMSEDRYREISSQLSRILSQIGIKDEIGREPTELTQEKRMIGEAIKDKVNEADQWFDKPLGDPDTYLKLGNFEYDSKNYEKAIGYYDKIIEMDIRNTDAWNSKGNALGNLGRYDEAIRCYDKALEIDPEHAYAWHNKGSALGNLGRYDEAIRCSDKALEIDPEHKLAKENRKVAKWKRRSKII